MSSIKVYVDGKSFGAFKEVNISRPIIENPFSEFSKYLPSEDIVVELNCRVDIPKAPEPIRCCRNCKHFQYLKSGEGYILPFCVDIKCNKNIACLQDKNIDSFERGCFVEREKK